MRLKKIFKNEKGSTAIIAAVAFVVVAAVCGLVVDLGTVYIHGSSMQNAADAAVYAIAPNLPLSVTDTDGIQNVQSTAETYLTRNEIDSDCIQGIELSDIVNGKYTSARVVVNDQVFYNFGPIVGVEGADVTKSAKVRLEAATSSTKMVPLGIHADQYSDAIGTNYAQDVVVKYGGGDGDTGFFGAIDLDGVKGGGAKDFASWLAFGYDGTLNIGEVLPVESGNMSGPTETAFTTRYSQCTHFPSQGGCTPEHYEAECPRVIYLIIYTMPSNKEVQIEGFVPFVLGGINSNGEITASHVDVSVNFGDSEEIDAGNIDYGLFRIRLVE